MDRISVTLSEATKLSGLGRSSLYKLFSQGKLRPLKSGKRTLLLVEDLNAYLKNLPIAEIRGVE